MSGSRRTRVLQVNKYYSETRGGVERVVEALAKGLADRGAHVRVLACGKGGWRTTVHRENGVLVVRAASPVTAMSMPVSGSFLALFRRLADWADIIHWHEPFPLASACALLFAANRKKIITWHSEIVRQRCLRPFVTPLQRQALSKAYAIVATSRELIKNSPVLPAFPKVRVIPLGIPDQVPCSTVPDEDAWRAKWRVNRRYALFVGRLVYYKGVDVLAQAMALSRAELVVVGQGPLANVLRQAKQHIGDRLTIIDRPVSDEELWLFYRNCEFLVFPSTHSSEAFGLVQLEAMRCGKPVVNTNLPTGVPSVSIHGLTGITVPVGDPIALAGAMDVLWTEGATRRALGRNAQYRARAHFGINAMIEQYMTIIQEAGAGIAGQSGPS